MRNVLSLGLILLAAAAGQTVEQDGRYWVRSAQTEQKALPPQVKRMEIHTRSNVVVRGSDDRKVSVKLRQRVPAPTSEAASRAWGPLTQVGPFILAGDVWRLDVYPAGSALVSTELEISVPRTLSAVWVINQFGSVQAYDLEGGFRADTGGGSVKLDRIGGNVIYMGFGDLSLGTIGGRVTCRLAGGSITLLSVAGEVNCSTEGGDIVVKSVGGPLTVSTGGGSIRVEKAGSDVRAKSREGQVEVLEARGTVIADSAAGGVRVRGGSGPLNVSAVMGNILAEFLSGARFSNSSLLTESGDITAMIPEGLGLVVRAQNASGVRPRIVSDFPEIQVRSVDWRSPSQMGQGWLGQGSIYGGGQVLDLNTNGGVIYLRRAK